MDQRDLLALLAARVLDRITHDALRAVPRDDRDRLRRRAARADVVLDARVDVLGVLAHDDQVDAGVAARHAGQRAHRPHVGVEIEVLPQRHVHRAIALALGRRQRTLERQRACARSIRCVRLGSGSFSSLDGGETGRLLVVRELARPPPRECAASRRRSRDRCRRRE